jgi:hypothetical protein
MRPEYTIFTGCSYTEGIGLKNTTNNEHLYVNKLYNSFDCLLKTTLLNLGVGGSSNSEIFQNSINAVTTNNCKYLFVEWTSLYRYKFSLGVEVYEVGQYWSPNQPLIDVKINPNISYSKHYLENIKNKFLSLHHDHYEIIKILQYSITINRLCKKLGVDVYFINGILPWDYHYFDYISNETRLPSDTTLYTQELLNAKTRNDEEFFKLYDRVHQEYQNTKGITECIWLNLDSGFRKNFMLDLGNDNQHPGEISHQTFGDHLIESFGKITNTGQV